MQSLDMRALMCHSTLTCCLKCVLHLTKSALDKTALKPLEKLVLSAQKVWLMLSAAKRAVRIIEKVHSAGNCGSQVLAESEPTQGQDPSGREGFHNEASQGAKSSTVRVSPSAGARVGS